MTTCGCCGKEYPEQDMIWQTDKYGEGEYFCEECVGGKRT